MASKTLSAEQIALAAPGLDAPGRIHVSVTKSDSTTYDPPLRKLYVQTGGNVVLKDMDGNSVTYTVPDYALIDWILITQVMSTNTTASGFKGAY